MPQLLLAGQPDCDITGREGGCSAGPAGEGDAAHLFDVGKCKDQFGHTASFQLQGFRRQSSLLFKILSTVRNHQINSDLAQLLLRLDYNKYYTQAGGTLGR